MACAMRTGPALQAEPAADNALPQIIKRQSLTELADYSDHLDRLAERAERAAAAPAASVSLGERAQLATECVQLLWLALSPAAIAASCRATSLLGEPVLIGFLPLDQQLLAAHALRDGGLLEQQVQGQQLEPVVEPAGVAHVEEEESVVEEQEEPVVEEVPAVVEEEPDVDVGEPVVEEQEELEEVDHQGDEQQVEHQQESEDQSAADQWVTGLELAQLLGVSLGGIRCWNAKGWLIEGQHYRKDPSNRRRHQYNVEAVRAAVASKSRKLRGVEARTPEGAEARRQLRVERQNLRRQAKRLTEPVGQEPEQAGGGRLEELLTALLMEVRGSGS